MDWDDDGGAAGEMLHSMTTPPGNPGPPHIHTLQPKVPEFEVRVTKAGRWRYDITVFDGPYDNHGLPAGSWKCWGRKRAEKKGRRELARARARSIPPPSWTIIT